MKKELNEIFKKIDNDFKDNIKSDSRYYMEVDIGKIGEEMGFSDIKEKYLKTGAIVPLKEPVTGMKVMIDGRTFVNYAQFESGIAAPEYIAKQSGLPYKTYIPNDSMILNFT